MTREEFDLGLAWFMCFNRRLWTQTEGSRKLFEAVHELWIWKYGRH